MLSISTDMLSGSEVLAANTANYQDGKWRGQAAVNYFDKQDIGTDDVKYDNRQNNFVSINYIINMCVYGCILGGCFQDLTL